MSYLSFLDHLSYEVRPSLAAAPLQDARPSRGLVLITLPLPIPHPFHTHSRTPQAYERVYEPCEDTFLMCDVLRADAERLIALSPGLAVEIG
jgi:hypothetical protein